jgi:UDP-glucuronate decarboxylase
VDDLIDGLVRLMNSEKSITGPINLGNPNEFTMISLANLIIDMTKSPSILNYTSLPADDPKQRRPDISKAAELLGWKPKIELAEGLQKTINEFSIRMNL